MAIMKKKYIKPIICVIPQSYDECLMESVSMGFGGPATGGGQSKPSEDWEFDGWKTGNSSNNDDGNWKM